MNYLKCLTILEENSNPCSDDEYLERSVKSMYYGYNSDSICGIKDTESVYLAVSHTYSKLVGLDQKNIIGKPETDIPCNTGSAYVFCQQDREVESSRTKHRYLNVYDYKTGTEAHIVNKLPIINPSTNNVLGTQYVAEKLELSSPIAIINKLYQHNRSFSGISLNVSAIPIASLKLTPREREVLFCISIGLTDRKTIANFLSMIHNKNIGHDTTVKDVLHSLYQKIPHINSIQTLMEYAISNGYNQSIPESILLEGSFSID